MLGVQLHNSIVYDLIEKVAPVQNDDMVFRKKPKSTTGLWTSTWREDSQDSAWIEWCRDENYGDPDTDHWFLLTPSEDARIYIIDSLADLKRLMSDYRVVSPYAPSEDSHLYKYYTGIDFERLAEDYDGLHLTEEGNAVLHIGYPIDMNAWDCESTVWFRWCFTSVQKVAVPQLLEH